MKYDAKKEEERLRKLEEGLDDVLLKLRTIISDETSSLVDIGQVARSLNKIAHRERSLLDENHPRLSSLNEAEEEALEELKSRIVNAETGVGIGSASQVYYAILCKERYAIERRKEEFEQMELPFDQAFDAIFAYVSKDGKLEDGSDAEG